MCERELETEQNCNILTLTLLAITVFLSRSLGLLNRGPESPLCWVLAFLPHLVTNGSGLQTNWLPVFTELYNSSTAHSISPHNWMCHFRCPWNGMFDCHRAEITVMQFTGHSLPVHQSVSVPWDFNPVPHCQPSSPTPMEYALPPSLEWHVWRGWRSIYNKSLGYSSMILVMFLWQVKYSCLWISKKF